LYISRATKHVTAFFYPISYLCAVIYSTNVLLYRALFSLAD